MPLIKVDIPTPLQMRGSWAANAAIHNAYGWDDFIYATEEKWFFHDGGGNWACIIFIEEDKAVLVGQDHEYSETFFRDAAIDFGYEETNLLKDAPSWWERGITPPPFGPYVGFIYGWDGKEWLRADYETNDGFKMVGLLDSMKVTGQNSISETVEHFKRPIVEKDIEALIAADGAISNKLLEAVMPGYKIQLGVEAANKFLLVELGDN